jgi:folylpolyglutamate synthase/dihydropteroate synthase
MLPSRYFIELTQPQIAAQLKVNHARMLADFADAIAREAAGIFRQLDAAQGDTAEIKQLRQAV